MTHSDPLSALSEALESRVSLGAAAVAAIDWGSHRHISAISWRPGVLVTSEQSLPRSSAYSLVRPGGDRVTATLAGRDPTTNVAVLRVEGGAGPFESTAPRAAGALVVALGADGHGGVTARLGPIEVLGPAWDSQAGGRIDHLIRIGIRLAPAAEGGPVYDAQGGILGMSTFGPRRTVLVIPSATITRVVDALLLHGRIARGWLGVGLHPVALPKDTQERAGATSGLMVVSVAEGAPAAGVLLQGDILLGIDGAPLHSARAVSAALGPEIIGRTADVRILRGGEIRHCAILIAARPA